MWKRSKHWHFAVNVPVTEGATVAETYNRWLFKLKNVLIGFASRPWIVAGSSNGIAFGMDQIDRWIAHTNLREGAWIILRQPAFGPDFAMAIVCDATGKYPRVTVCEDGFTGGLVPKANGPELRLHNAKASVALQGDDTTEVSTLHVLHASDGTATYVFGTRNGVSETLWVLARPLGSTRFVGGIDSHVEALIHWRTLKRMRAGFLHTLFQRRSEPVEVATQIATYSENEIAKANEVVPVIVTGKEGRLGVLGCLPDLFVSLGKEGTTYEANGFSHQFITFGTFVVPWCGGAGAEEAQGIARGVLYEPYSGLTEAPPLPSVEGALCSLAPGQAIQQYQMRAYKTVDPIGYVYWTASGAPDVTGAGSGHKPSDLQDIVVC